MIKDEPKQLTFLLSPSIFDETIPEDHLMIKLEECVDWKSKTGIQKEEQQGKDSKRCHNARGKVR